MRQVCVFIRTFDEIRFEIIFEENKPVGLFHITTYEPVVKNKLYMAPGSFPLSAVSYLNK